MGKPSLGTDDAIDEALRKYSDMVRRICYLYLRNQSDVEDVFQEVFLKLLQNKKPFENEEHEKSWICRVAINQCKDLCRSFFRRNVCSIEDLDLPFEDQRESDVMSAVLSLPTKYKAVIYLFYYENYTVSQIAKLLKHNENTIYSHLHRARKLLKEKLGGSDYDYVY